MTDQIVTKSIVLSRTNYQEADRILTVLTPQNGKLSVIAKGARRPKSKLAGGIELFSVNDITVLRGKSELRTLVSSRLHTHYGRIVSDIQRTMLGYDFLKQIHRATEAEPGDEYYQLLQAALAGLDDVALPAEFVEVWFRMALLRANGNQPELYRDTDNVVLQATNSYVFDFDTMRFKQQSSGPYTANHIKLLRIIAGASTPSTLGNLRDAERFLGPVAALVQNIVRQHA